MQPTATTMPIRNPKVPLPAKTKGFLKRRALLQTELTDAASAKALQLADKTSRPMTRKVTSSPTRPEKARQPEASSFGKTPSPGKRKRSMLNATIYYNSIVRNYSQSLANTAAEPSVARATSYFLAHIGKVKTVDDLLNNSQLYTYVMKAYGLGDMLYAKGLIRKVLEGGVSSSTALANTLNDKRYKALATAFNFAADGTATTTTTAARQGTVNNYLEQKLESNAGQQNPGTQMALYFRNQAPNITSAYSILADPTLLKVVQTALNLPVSMSQANIDVQASMINQKLNISDLQDPAKLQKFIERFTATYDAQNPMPTSAVPTSALLVTQPGISSNLLLSIANLKLGGS
jgi:hypothetical protein